MKEYRKRFVQMAMLLVGAVLLVMMAVIAVYMYRDYYDSLRATMEQVVEPLDSFAEPMGARGQQAVEQIADGEPQDKMGMDRQSGQEPGGLVSPAMDAQSDAETTPPNVEETGHDIGTPENNAPRDPARQGDGRQQGIMTVFYVPDTDEVTVLSQESLYDEETLADILTAVITQGEGYGTLTEYHVIYYCSGNGNPYKIALASTGYILVPMLRLILVLALIWILAMGALLLVSIQMSRVAVRPMEEAMARERQFVADASHDLKTPLSVILANNSILMENPDATVGSLERWTSSTQSAARNMQQMIGEMLTLADAEREDAPLVMETLDVAEIMMRAVLQLESVAYEKGVTLESDLPDELLLRTNEDYLQRITTSLIENAIKYETTGGTVVVRLVQRERHVELTVTNQHATIDEADLPHIFERFYRADKSRHDAKTSGHGLGLAITRQMVLRLGGQIVARSSVEGGTCFAVTLERGDVSL